MASQASQKCLRVKQSEIQQSRILAALICGPGEDPALLDVHHGKEGDGECPDDEVRHRQGEEEVVGDCL